MSGSHAGFEPAHERIARDVGPVGPKTALEQLLDVAGHREEVPPVFRGRMHEQQAALGLFLVQLAGSAAGRQLACGAPSDVDHRCILMRRGAAECQNAGR